MTFVRDLSADRLGAVLCTGGLHLQTGMFTTWVRSDHRGLAASFKDLYQDYRLRTAPGIDDFSVAVWRSRRPGHKIRPHVEAAVENSRLFEPQPSRFAAPLLESCLNWAFGLYLSRYMLLHAAVVERDGMAMIMTGPSGSGKSTLCAALTARGWRLLSDEIAIVRPEDCMLVPNPRPISLKNNSIDLIQRLAPDAHFSQRYFGTGNGTVAFMRAQKRDIARDDELAVPRLVIFPRYSADATGAPRFGAVDRIRSFMGLVDQAVNYDILHRTGFEAISRLVESCHAFELELADIDAAVATLNDAFQALGDAGKAA